MWTGITGLTSSGMSQNAPTVRRPRLAAQRVFRGPGPLFNGPGPLFNPVTRA